MRSSLATQQSAGTLSPVVAKLFNAAAQNVEVSFQVTTNPDEVVTVFTDRSTGKEIIQFPSQALIALAEMYDKDAGKVLDKSA
ncbi:MAG TPA: flagellar protein FlaG [Candidatus Lustribacter sp.]